MSGAGSDVPAPPASRHPGQGNPARGNPAQREPAERGRLDIDSAVLRTIVEFAADGSPGTLRHERRVAGIGMGSAGAGAKVFEGPDGAVDVALELTLQYPASVRATVDTVRARVAGELARITGRRVRNLSVTVSGLRGADDTAPAGPRVQ